MSLSAVAHRTCFLLSLLSQTQYLCLTLQKKATREEHDCIPDEHYVQTLFSVSPVIDSIDLEVRTDIIIRDS
jgi:hypothetical protein